MGQKITRSKNLQTGLIMNVVFWILSSALLLFAGYAIVMNWAVFTNNYILKKKWSSAVPLVGGATGAIGLICLPLEGLWKFAWIPLVLDWGSIPVIVVSLICYIERRRKGLNNED